MKPKNSLVISMISSLVERAMYLLSREDNMRRTCTPLVLVALLVSPLNGAAQDGSGNERAQSRGADLRADMPREVGRTVSMMVAHRARMALDLSDEQVLKLLPFLDAMEESRRQSIARRRETAAQLERIWREKEPADDETVMKLIRSLDAEEARARKEQDETRDEMLAILEPHQKAGFVIFAGRLRQRFDRRGTRGGRGPAAMRPGGQGRSGLSDAGGGEP